VWQLFNVTCVVALATCVKTLKHIIKPFSSPGNSSLKFPHTKHMAVKVIGERRSQLSVPCAGRDDQLLLCDVWFQSQTMWSIRGRRDHVTRWRHSTASTVLMTSTRCCQLIHWHSLTAGSNRHSVQMEFA